MLTKDNSLLTNFTFFNQPLSTISDEKILIYAINAHSFNVSKSDIKFKEAMLHEKTILLPDGIGIVWALNFLRRKNLKRITGMDLMNFELKKLDKIGGKCFFLGSSESTLLEIKNKINIQYPNIKVAYYSPPFSDTFTSMENDSMIKSVNEFTPDVLFVGMTAPKQEKWAHQNFDLLSTGHICCIGAAFDFYAGTLKRAPRWMMNYGLEWLYRLFKEPVRMFNRYVIGITKFIITVLKEKFLIRRSVVS
jgi:N-acetylglucosaminyldiphosphoundecaprenol N-acetyl-beta-D-mannosaminyltransferase